MGNMTEFEAQVTDPARSDAGLRVSRIRRFAPRNASAGAGAGGWTLAALALALLAALPLAAILWESLAGDTGALRELADTVLPNYILNTALLMLLAGGIAGVTGTGCAWAIAATRFPGRRVLGWALVLPLALPAYLSAYLYADMLDFAGPVQSALRGLTGWGAGDYWFPDIRSLGGGAFVLGSVLYPYVYLMARTSFATQSLTQFRAARSLGAGPSRVLARIYAPLLAPSLAGAAALVFIDTLRELPATMILRHAGNRAALIHALAHPGLG